MPTISRILFPTDFSECAQDALPAAVGFAGHFGAHLHMLHVRTARDGVMDEPPTPFPGEIEAVAQLGAPDGRERVTHHVVHNPVVAPTILELAQDLDIDLIVIGSHGRRGMRRWILGSVAGEVLRGATCPVVVVPPIEDGAPRVATSRILAPLDFSGATEALVREAETLAIAGGAGLDLIHVIEPPAYPDFYVATLALPETRRRVGERLERIAARLDSKIEVGVDVLDGRASEEIADYAEKNGHQLIVVADGGRLGLRRVLGSTAESVTRRAPCPVWVSKGGARLDDASRDDTVVAAEAVTAGRPAERTQP